MELEQVSVSNNEEEIQLVLAGEFDISNTHNIVQTFDEHWKTLTHPKSLLVDLRKVSFIDVSGINNILKCALKVMRGGKEVVIVSNQDHINKILNLLQITRIFKTYSQVEPAQRYLKNRN